MNEKLKIPSLPSEEEQEIQNLSEQYLNHRIYTDIKKYADFYNLIAMSTLNFMNIDTYLYSSIRSTLRSISEILNKGRINDAYTLLRKYHDSAIINIYTNLFLKKIIIMKPNG